MTAVDTSLIMLHKYNIKSKFKFSEGNGIGFRMLDTPRKSVDFEVVARFSGGGEMPLFIRISFLPETENASYKKTIGDGLSIDIKPEGEECVRFNISLTSRLSENDSQVINRSACLPRIQIRGLFSKPKPR